MILGKYNSICFLLLKIWIKKRTKEILLTSTKKESISMKTNYKTILIGAVTGFANGLFGSGGGTIVVPCMERFLGVEEHKAHATAIAIILPLSLLSIAFYVWKTDVLWSVALWASLGGVIGGFIGAKLLDKVSGKWLHRIFGLFMIIAAVRMIV